MCVIEHDHFSQDHIPVILAQLAYIPLIVISNLLIMVSTRYVKQLQTPDNILLACLAVVDMSIGVIIIPLQVIKDHPATQKLIHNKHLCIFWHVMSTSLFMTSLGMLTLIVIFKWSSINYPFWYMENVGKGEAIRASFVVTALNFALYTPFKMQAYKYNEPEVLKPRQVNNNDNKNSSRIGRIWDGRLAHRSDLRHNDLKDCSQRNIPAWFLDYGIFGMVFLEIIVSAILCVQITVTAKRMSARRSDRKATLVICLLFLFCVLWFPTVLQIDKLTGDFSELACVQLVFTARQFRLFNSFVNALAYGTLHKVHRYAYGFLLTQPPWRWSRVGTYMRDREKKEVMKGYVKELNKRINEQQKVRHGSLGLGLTHGMVTAVNISNKVRKSTRLPKSTQSTLESTQYPVSPRYTKSSPGNQRRIYHGNRKSISPIEKVEGGTRWGSISGSTVLGPGESIEHHPKPLTTANSSTVSISKSHHWGRLKSAL